MRVSPIPNKAQAAMEFLMTYGWAILVVLAAIGALAYFGVLSPAKFLPEKCLLEPGFLCEGHKVETDKITLVVSNTVEGRTITVNSITVGSCSSAFTTELVGGASASSFVVGGACSNGAVKERYKGDISIGYTEKNTNLTKTMYGSLNSKVE
ncbi:hypothetical protein HYX05_00170 [Candidatus Woesearchaeota archaeon]|nr:hypothetical protein [Candidatus Woesearchaeota archaeon]